MEIFTPPSSPHLISLLGISAGRGWGIAYQDPFYPLSPYTSATQSISLANASLSHCAEIRTAVSIACLKRGSAAFALSLTGSTQRNLTLFCPMANLFHNTDCFHRMLGISCSFSVLCGCNPCSLIFLLILTLDLFVLLSVYPPGSYWCQAWYDWGAHLKTAVGGTLILESVSVKLQMHVADIS